MTIFPFTRPLIALLAFAALACTADFAPAQPDEEQPSIRYDIDLREAARHEITVRADIPVAGETTELMMAVWTPGSYLVREYAQHVSEIAAEDTRGRRLVLTKTTKNRWQVATPGRAKTFRLTYRVYCRDRSVRTNWVDDRYAVLNGAPTFITRPDMIESPHVVALELPTGWRRSATSMLGDGDAAHQYRAESFHELVDSPIVAGEIELFPFEAGGVSHALVNVNDHGFWDGGRSIKDLKKIVEAHQELWGRTPYSRYLFINVIGEGGGGGLEHDNSCLLMASPYTCADPGRYRGWLSLCSHEFFHAWNVRRLRPRELATYNYEQENYTPSLWVAEGVTTYYEDLMLARAGILDEMSMVGILSGSVSSLQQTPGRLKQSLRDSSHDAWIKYYRTSENSRFAEVSYYTKGAVVAWLLDVEIRSATEGAKSLDDVLRLLWRRNANREGYTAEDFRDACNDVAGRDLGDWFARAVDSTEELDYQTAANWFGLDIGPFRSGREAPVAREDEPAGGAEEAEADSRPARRNRGPRRELGQAWLGFTATDRDGRLMVGSVTPDSPATEAGISIDDEVLAINDLRLTGSLETRLQLYPVGETVRLLIARDQRIIEVTMRVGRRQFESWGVSVAAEDDGSLRKQREAWLGIEGGEGD